MFRKALLLLSGNAFTSLLILVRNLLVARMIPLEDYGIAATFAIVIAVFEMTAQIGLNQQIVQSDRGDDPYFQAALQGFQFLRNMVTAVDFALGGGLMADFMNVPEVAWAYRLLALVPLFRAFQHLGIARMSREMKYMPAMAMQAVPAMITLALVWPLTLWLGDYRVMLCVILLQAVITTVASHLLVHERWRMVIDRPIIFGAMRFGWPILVNNFLIFAVFNGDRLIVGRELGLATLAIFSMGMTMTMTPIMVFSRSVQSFFLPQLSRTAREAPEAEKSPRFQQLSAVMIELVLVSSLVFLLGVVLFAAPLVRLLLDDKYLPLLPYLPLFGMALGLRMFATGPTVVALSRARTGNAMIANIPRLITLPLSWWVAVRTGDLQLLILLMILNEALGPMLSFAVLSRQITLPRREVILSWLMTLPFFVATGIMVHLGQVPDTGPVLAGFALCLVLALVPMRALRGYLVAGIRRRWFG